MVARERVLDVHLSTGPAPAGCRGDDIAGRHRESTPRGDADPTVEVEDLRRTHSLHLVVLVQVWGRHGDLSDQGAIYAYGWA